MNQTSMQTQETITFSFGENWKSFLNTVSDSEILAAQRDIDEWFVPGSLEGKTVIDIGCGSGIHSLALHRRGVSQLLSFDYDPRSVEATRQVWDKEKRPANWKVMQGSILDRDFIRSLGQFDVVYSWGVLHHTGSMWEAIENSCTFLKENGLYMIALYVKGPNYQRDLELKRKYNRVSNLGKRFLEFRHYIFPMMFSRLTAFKNPFAWNERRERGMEVYHDIKDWLGGLPYEVASIDEVVAFTRPKGFVLEKVKCCPEGACSVYLFSMSPGRPNS